jgi:hypothetical protein
MEMSRRVYCLRTFIFHAVLIALHLILAVACYLFLPWEDIQKPLGIASAVIVTIFLTALFISWSIFGEPSAQPMTRDQ